MFIGKLHEIADGSSESGSMFCRGPSVKYNNLKILGLIKKLCPWILIKLLSDGTLFCVDNVSEDEVVSSSEVLLVWVDCISFLFLFLDW